MTLLCLLQLACLRAFGSIWGAGKAKAEELYASGFRTIEDVRARGRDRLTRQQLVGLDRSGGDQTWLCTTAVVLVFLTS